ncbi:MAG: hypothetical protein ACOYMG_06875, partial [Candidatus Methylumidiphilus sp.]
KIPPNPPLQRGVRGDLLAYSGHLCITARAGVWEPLKGFVAIGKKHYSPMVDDGSGLAYSQVPGIFP